MGHEHKMREIQHYYPDIHDCGDHITDNQGKTRAISKFNKIKENYFIDAADEPFTDWFNIKHKEKILKIQGSYWDTVQKIEKQRNEVLNTQQLQLVNQQIGSEFDIDELKVLLALKQSKYEEL